MKKSMNFGWLRMAAALVIALALLAATGFGFVHLLAEPVSVSDGAQLEGQRYVSADVKYLMALVGEEVRSGETVAYYAIAPVGNEFVILRFEAALKADIEQLCSETVAYLSGESSQMRVHMPVKGMVEDADEAVSALLSQWFDNNKEWMSAAGVVGAEPAAEDYLCAQVILVDRAGSMSGEMTAALSLIALLMAAYALVELVFLLKKKEEAPAKKDKKEKKEKKPQSLPGAEALAAELAQEAEDTEGEQVVTLEFSVKVAAGEDAEETEEAGDSEKAEGNGEEDA